MIGQYTYENVVLITNAAQDDDSKFGTGFAVCEDGCNTYIVTCAHVLRHILEPEGVYPGVTGIKVRGKEAEVIWIEPEPVDLAVLRVEAIDNIEVYPLGACGDIGIECEVVGFSKIEGDVNHAIRVRSI